MQEQVQKQPTRLGSKKRQQSGDESEAKGTIIVSYGVHELPPARLEGKKVSEVRKGLSTALNIDPEANSLVNGQEVNEDYVLKKNDQLEFVQLAGSKG